jgi:hypothetical protein
MANEQFTIDLGDDQRALLVTDDEAWLREKLRQEPGATRIRVRYDGDEVEGHRSGAGLGVRVIADDLDTEGHAIALHFPSREEADAFRKRLMLTGVIVGSVAIGAVTGAGLASMQVEPSGKRDRRRSRSRPDGLRRCRGSGFRRIDQRCERRHRADGLRRHRNSSRCRRGRQRRSKHQWSDPPLSQGRQSGPGGRNDRPSGSTLY